MVSGKFQSTTKDVGLLSQLHNEDQLTLKPEFQRNSIWPRNARAYLIDTILEGYPIPMIYLQRSISAQTRRPEYSVIDGQQRLSTVFSFLENKFMLTESDPSKPWFRKRWRQLDPVHQEAILNYDFTVLEFSGGYQDSDIREMFRRINKYVVSLNPQELRHSSGPGVFKALVERVGSESFWTEMRVFTDAAKNRMRSHEMAAELLILLSEGPQDKKSSVDLYYEAFAEDFPQGEALERRLAELIDMVRAALPGLKSTSHLRKPATFYSLIGALDTLTEMDLSPAVPVVGERLVAFEAELESPEEVATERAKSYASAASRQTDNLRPRERRIDILKSVILGE